MGIGNFYPTVIVPGIGQSKTVQLDLNGEVIRTSWPLDIDMEALKKKLVPSAVRMMLLRHDAGFAATLKSALCDVLDPLRCNPDGSQKNDIRVVTYKSSIAKCSDEGKHFIRRMVPYERFTDVVGEELVYYFTYNPFGRAYETIEELHSYIENVKKETGSSKVNLIVISLGGTIATAYLHKYGSCGDLHRVVGIVPAFDGSSVFSDIMSKNFDYANYESLFCTLLGNKEGKTITSLLKKIPQKLVPKYIDAILDAVTDTVLLNSPMMWGIMPSDRYEELSAKFISDEAHKRLRERADEEWKVRADFPALVRRMKESGVEMFSLCGYNTHLFAVSSTNTSDMIVDTKSASMGACCAPVGVTLVSDYKQQNLHCTGHSHLSPDEMIDASAGAMPDTTWFYKNMEHEDCAVCENLLKLAGLLISSDEITDVFSSAEFPQFNEYRK